MICTFESNILEDQPLFLNTAFVSSSLGAVRERHYLLRKTLDMLSWV